MSYLSKRAVGKWRPVRLQLAASLHESSHLSASVNAFLNQLFSAVQHGSSEVYY
jgi:hypothetical protein